VSGRSDKKRDRTIIAMLHRKINACHAAITATKYPAAFDMPDEQGE
jgi:hypothetical protein